MAEYPIIDAPEPTREDRLVGVLRELVDAARTAQPFMALPPKRADLERAARRAEVELASEGGEEK